MSDTRYPKSCNKMLMLHDNIGRTNWVTVLQFIRYTQHMYTYDMRRNKHNIHTYYRTRLFWSKNNNDKENKYKIFTISIRLWISQDVGHINMFVSPCKQRLNDCLTQNWSDNLSSSSRCDTYCTFKSLFMAW